MADSTEEDQVGDEQEKAILQVLKADRKSQRLAPTRQEMDALEPLRKTRHGPPIKYIDTLSGEDYVSHNSHLGSIFSIALLRLQPEGDTGLTQDMEGATLQCCIPAAIAPSERAFTW